MNNDTTLTTNREYKSSIFEMIFSEKAKLLELYNAINDTNYDDPDLLEINTLKNAIYMSMHNDISFIIDSQLSLYEHQSTINPNLPLRYLMYISDYSIFTAKVRSYTSKMSIYEYDAEKHIRMEREDAKADGRLEERICSIKSLMETLSLSAEQAMAALKIPAEEYSKYIDKLKL